MNQRKFSKETRNDKYVEIMHNLCKNSFLAGFLFFKSIVKTIIVLKIYQIIKTWYFTTSQFFQRKETGISGKFGRSSLRIETAIEAEFSTVFYFASSRSVKGKRYDNVGFAISLPHAPTPQLQSGSCFTPP